MNILLSFGLVGLGAAFVTYFLRGITVEPGRAIGVVVGAAFVIWGYALPTPASPIFPGLFSLAHGVALLVALIAGWWVVQRADII